MESMPQSESEASQNTRFVEGKMSENEIRAHWSHPDKPLFEHTLSRSNAEGKQESTTFRVRALTENFSEALFESLKKSWAFEGDYESLKETVTAFHTQRELPHPGTVNPEYYIATDTEDNAYAMTGIYTRDMEGQGFALRDKLDSKKHYINAGLGWFAVSPEKQGNGVGGFLHDWIVKMAAARGAKHMVIETDDSPGEANAIALYEKRGYTQGFTVKDYYGPGRDHYSYFAHFPRSEDAEPPQPLPAENISAENKEEVCSLAEKIYSPERFEEFKACIDLLLMQKKGEPVIQSPDSYVHKNEQGKVIAFAILAPSLYANAVTNYWYGSEPGNEEASKVLMDTVQRYAGHLGRETVIVHREGEDDALKQFGYQIPERGIPFVYMKGDKTNYLLYTKDLEKGK